MSRPSAGGPDGGRTVLLLWTFIVFAGVAAATMLGSVSTEVAASGVFGSPGTQLALVGVLVSTMVGTVVAWRPHGVSLRACQATVLLLFVAVGVTTVLSLGFFAGGDYPVVGILLVQSAVFVAVIAGRLHRSVKGISAARCAR